MRKSVFSTLIALLMLTCSTSRAISTITSSADLRVLDNVIEDADRNTLVIFDVDYVLIMPTAEYALQKYPYRKRLWKKMRNRLPKEKIKLLQSIITVSSKWRLMDPRILNTLNTLKTRQIPTIALTGHHTGKLGVIDNLEDLRIKELNSLNIDFSKSSTMQSTISMHKFSGQFGTPMMKQGIILTAEQNKDLILEYILQKHNYTPKKIIFVDDKLHNIELLQNLCKKLKIDFQGFHYTVVSEMIFVECNSALEPLRFKVLEQEHRWLSYKELNKWMEL